MLLRQSQQHAQSLLYSIWLFAMMHVGVLTYTSVMDMDLLLSLEIQTTARQHPEWRQWLCMFCRTVTMELQRFKRKQRICAGSIC